MATPKAVIAIGVKDDSEPMDGMNIPVPDGFTPPDGVEGGETFQVMADVRMEEGKLILEKLDGKEVGKVSPPEDEKENEPPKPSIMGTYTDMMKGAQ